MAEIVNPHLRGAVDHLMTQVTPENVLGVRRVILQEVTELRDLIEVNDNPSDYATSPAPLGGQMGTPGSGFYIGLCSEDPISGPAQISFNRKIAAAVQDCKDYVTDLSVAGEKLAAIARSYAVTEDEIESSFASVRLPW